MLMITRHVIWLGAEQSSYLGDRAAPDGWTLLAQHVGQQADEELSSSDGDIRYDNQAQL